MSIFIYKWLKKTTPCHGVAWRGVACRYAAGTGSTEYEKDGELVVTKVGNGIYLSSFARLFYTNNHHFTKTGSGQT